MELPIRLGILYSIGIIWTLQGCTAELPNRTFEAFIAGNDLSLELTNESLCVNISEGQSIDFQRLIINDNNLYIGATNHILQVDLDSFTVSESASLGPYDDDVDCIAPYICRSSSCGDLQCVDNKNRLLLLHRDQLIACGSIYAGTCDILTLSNVSLPYQPTPDDNTLKCSGDGSQITRHSGNLSVAALYTNQQDASKDLLYVGNKGSIDTLFPPGSDIAEFTRIDKTSTYATENADRKFIKTWVTEFHNFMLWTTAGGKSYISRVCHTTLNEYSRNDIRSESDEGYGQSSYTESAIECSGYTNALLAYYRYGKLYLLFEKNGGYVLCSTSLNSMNNHIEDARRTCFQGETPKAVYITDNRECYEIQDMKPTLVTCGLSQKMYQFVSPIRCQNPLGFKNEFTWPNDMEPPTTIAIDLFAGYTIAFFGTNNGEIIKARIGNSASVFTEKIILEENQPILQDVGFDKSSHIYAMSPNKIFKVKLSNCNQYETCGSCVSSNDPYCGWCVLQSRCTHKSKCDESDRPTNWMKINIAKSECPRVSVVTPDALSVAESQELSLTLGGSVLPDYSYNCEFVTGDQILHTSPLKNFPTAPTCYSPPDSTIIPDNQDKVDVALHIKAGSAIVASGLMEIYDCRRIPKINNNTMCGSCVSSSWGCTWCTNSNSCEDQCAGSVGIISIDECPSLTEVLNATNDVPVGKAREFTLVTKNLPKSHDFDCVLNICDFQSKVVVPGSRNGDSVSCNIPENKMMCNKEDSTIMFSLRSGTYYVDTPRLSTVTVDLFNCTGTQAECGLCIISNSRHEECTWCNNICIPDIDCKDGGVTNISSCPAPIIESINPTSGPINGGTEITLDGINIGSSSGEILSVTVGSDPGIACNILPEKYVPSKRIVCVTAEATPPPVIGKIKIKLSYIETDVTSDQMFTFKEVTVAGFEPKYALLGTKVTIKGSNLDVGNNAKVKISKNAVSRVSQCLDRTSDHISCLLPEAPSIGDYSIWTSLDGFSQRMLGEIQFVARPEIKGLIGRDKLVSFYSGGVIATFKLSSLLGIQSVVLQVDGGEINECKLDVNTTTVRCPIPAIQSQTGKRSKRSVPTDDSTSRAAEPTFVSAEIVINDNLRIPLSGKFNLSYVSNPSMNSLASMPCRTTENTYPTPTQEEGQGANGTSSANAPSDSSDALASIQLTGKYLDLAAVKEDYTITIQPLEGDPGTVDCIPSFLESESLICKAPASALRKYEGKKILVTVKVGNLTFPIKADYCPGGEGASIEIIASTASVVAVLLIIIIALVLRHRNRSIKQQKEREQIMLMLDTLENKTRETARNAYVELQLGYMETLTDNLSDSITYLPPVSCFMRALFNDWTPDHPMLNSKSTSGIPDMKIAGLDEFIQLLKKKEFLITLVKTLEDQKHFTVKEKGQFASLLTVCLFDDLVYFTSVMMDLLSDLIQKHVGKNPKLLLRRSESVVEKMVSHWLCVNLYSGCIKDQAGKPLYLLTKAIHFLVNSAPCDVVANKAVNSLNEMTLLGSEVSYEAITLKACVVEKGVQSAEFVVKVVNCDTITQVKEKIIEVVYRDRPFSENPKPNELELELVAGQGHIVLSDIDNMSFEERNYTMINTLKFYNIKDGAAVLLSPVKPELNGAAETASPPPPPQKRRLFHLIHPRDRETNGFVEDDDSGNKTKKLFANLMNQPFQEIYLTRMVKSKTTVQEYVDAVFNSILTPVPISRAVKYFFQFLDKEALKHKISDPEVVHIWKTNSLLLRYWVNILKNPEFLFDLNKTAIVDSCLNVITQAFMDACTTTHHKLGQDSPSNKLLYAKDAERYKKMVTKFFENVANEENAGEEELNESLRGVSTNYAAEFNSRAAAQQLYEHLDKYRSQVQTAVEELDNHETMSSKLNSVIAKLSPETNGHSHEKNNYDTSILV